MLAKGLGRCVLLITLEHSSDHLSSCGSCALSPELQSEKVVSEGRGHGGPTDFHTHWVRTLRYCDTVFLLVMMFKEQT